MPANALNGPDRRFSVAPMMDCTTSACRVFHRLISRHALLYTEMVTTGALIHGDRDRFLRFDDSEHPVALQLGGSDPAALAECARMAEQWGYDEVNLNCGCPSDRVQSGRFGASLMADPNLVAAGMAAMRDAVSIPVTIKTRIGIDRDDSVDRLYTLVEAVRKTGCRTFIIHARKAWLDGLSPKENREIPPLRYDVVHQLKRDFPELEIIINGGFKDIDGAAAQLQHCDGVMLGRAPYHDPYLLADVDRRFFGADRQPPSRTEIAEAMMPYIQRELANGQRFGRIARHMAGLFLGQPNGRLWRRHLSEQGYQADADANVLLDALALVV